MLIKRMFMKGIVFMLAVSALPIFLTLTLSIAFQAWLADRMGDSTPRFQGRLTWDPINHMDWVGTVIAPLLSILMMGGAGMPIFFGWAKPLELNMQYYRTKTKQILIESPALLIPLLMALVWMLINKLLVDSNSFMEQVSAVGVKIGIGFFAVGLIPIPPFPLGNWLLKYLPNQYTIKFIPYMQYSFLILIILLLTGILRPYLGIITHTVFVLLDTLTAWI